MIFYENSTPLDILVSKYTVNIVQQLNKAEHLLIKINKIK